MLALCCETGHLSFMLRNSQDVDVAEQQKPVSLSALNVVRATAKPKTK